MEVFHLFIMLAIGNTMNTRNLSLDLLRGLSILYIVGYWHMFNYTNAFPQYYNIVTLRITWIVLATFTFVSGYFIGLKNIDFSKESIFSFYKNRVLRIYPLYLVALIIFFVFGMANLFTISKAAIAVSMFFHPAPPTLWYITMLLFFYLVSPLLIMVVKRNKTAHIWVFYVFVSIWLVIIHYVLRTVDVRVITYFPAFYLGLLTSIKGDGYIKRSFLVSLIILGLFVSFAFNQNKLQIDWLLSTILVSTGAYCVFMFFKNIIELPKTSYFPVFALSYSSYCMYLFHRPIYMVFRKIYFPTNDIAQVVYLVFFCLPIILISSYYIQKCQDNILILLTYKD
ncbi:MAG: acyltransferase [Deltaproteobacteria bacterium]|nr:acyltransferase [Deltaproteobacteria bacterium]